MQRRSRLSHIPALDGVRGIAVVGVLFFHAGHLSGGFLGVDLFFTLSGFLITSLLIAEWREHGTVRLSAFWARRARRLLPALFIVLTLAALYGALLAGDTELGRLRGDAFASLFYVSNWWQIGHRQSYWDIFTAGSPLAHMWSLAIEEQFYLVWPIVFFVVIKRAGRRALPWLFATTAVLTAASAVAMAWLHHPGSDPTRVYEGSDTRRFDPRRLSCGHAVAGRGPRSPPVAAGHRNNGLRGRGRDRVVMVHDRRSALERLVRGWLFVHVGRRRADHRRGPSVVAGARPPAR
jgi:peptidoglycan/LPS O-acetylase OafA/YrhL